MSRKRILTSAQVADARRAIASGRSIREVARSLGCSDTAVRRYLAGAPTAPTAPGAAVPSPAVERARALVAGAPAAPDPPAPAPAPIDVDQDVRSLVRELLERTLRLSAEAEREGNYTAAQRAMRDAAANLAPLLARLDKLHGEQGQYVVKMTKEDALRVRAELEAKVARMRSRPLQCSTCSRELSMALSEDREPNYAHAGGEGGAL